ncbi:MAG: hypothetical protein KC506_00075 [Nanoarchaeota archaeon]|nr:hypothetical protein [Nanoarchaeota archaeon]
MTEEKTKPTENMEEKNRKEKFVAKPLPVDKEKTKEIEEKMKSEKDSPKSEKKDEAKSSEKKPKSPEKQKVRKYEAFAKGQSLHVSKKQCMYLCNFIKNKKIDDAISDLEKVVKMKKAVPFKGEIPHRKGNIASGRYPVKAAKLFITMLKGLKGNAIVNLMELEETKIFTASASWARRPMRSGNRQGKRTNVVITAKDFSSSKKEEKVKNKNLKEEKK